MAGNNILDDDHFINNLVEGEAVWSGKPNFYEAIPIKEVLQEIILFLIFTFFVIVAYTTTDFLIGQPNIIRFWVILLSVVYVIYYFFRYKKWYEFSQEMKSTYIITSSYLAQQNENGKLAYCHSLNGLYHVVIKKEKRNYGEICMRIKRKGASKRKRITVSQQMMWPDISFKGLENAREIAELLVKTRNTCRGNMIEEE